MSIVEGLKYNEQGLIPAVIQDHTSGEVLMMAWMSRESLQKTIDTGLCTYWSRSRNELWLKGETSGHYQHVRNIAVDCDMDTLLIEVEQEGAACHDNYRSCFYRELRQGEWVENQPKLAG